MRLAALVLGVGLSLALLGAAPQAHAFEREWHVGAGAGATSGNGLKLSPALAAYAAYGLSDVFDTGSGDRDRRNARVQPRRP